MDKTNDRIQSASRPAVTPVYPQGIKKPSLAGVKLEENIYVAMRDGIKLAADIYRPEAEGRYPVLFSMCPYLKEIQQYPPGWSHSIEAGATGFFVPKGYIHVICQARGSGLSQGQWKFLDRKEQEDGYDMIEWIAQQPWCDGNVGMIGDSYWAWIQYLVATQKPPHLKCIVPHDGGTDMYRDTFYQGGILNSGEFLNHWINDTIFQCVWPGAVEGKQLPIDLAASLAANPDDGPFYWERSACTMLDKIEVPVLNCVPLTRIHSRSQLIAYAGIKAVQRLIVEPEAGYWSHLHYLLNRPLNEQILRWLDHWLKGVNTGIMDEPEVAIFDTGTQEWRYENEYPLERTRWTRFYLRSGPSGNAKKPPYGLISPEPPGTENPDRYMVPESTEQLLAGKPVLAYTTLPLTEDLRVWGPLSMTLYGSSTGADTAWFVKLKDVAPDGYAMVISRGILRASYWEVDEAKSRPGQPFHPFRNRRYLEPDKVYEFQIEMRPIFHTFKEGHKICVEIASDDPAYFGSLHSLDIIGFPTPAENAVHHNGTYPSNLYLPVIPDAPIIREVGPPISNVKWTLMPGTFRPNTEGWPLLSEGG